MNLITESLYSLYSYTEATATALTQQASTTLAEWGSSASQQFQALSNRVRNLTNTEENPAVQNALIVPSATIREYGNAASQQLMALSNRVRNTANAIAENSAVRDAVTVVRAVLVKVLRQETATNLERVLSDFVREHQS